MHLYEVSDRMTRQDRFGKCSACGKSGRKLIRCSTCGSRTCLACNFTDSCKNCESEAFQKNTGDYFADKYSKGIISIMLVISFFILVLMSSTVGAVEFNNEEWQQGLTEFRWCFDSPFGDAAVYDGDIEPYIIKKIGCDDVSIKIVREQSVTIKDTVCSPVYSCDDTEDENGSIITSCDVTGEECSDVYRIETEQHPLDGNSLLLTSTDRICVLGSGNLAPERSCDMNFVYENKVDQALYDEAEISWDTRDYGRAWWNVSFLMRRNVTNEGRFSNAIYLNNSESVNVSTNSDYIIVDRSSCEGDVWLYYSAGFSDFAVANDTTECDYFMENEGRGNGDFSEYTGYLFGNSTIRDFTGTFNDGNNSGATHLTSGCKFGNCWDFDGGSDSLDIADGSIPISTSFSISLWWNTDAVDSSDNFIGDETNTNNRFLFYLRGGDDIIKVFQNVGGTTKQLDEGSAKGYQASTWYHSVYTYNSSSGLGKIYTNGVETASGSMAALTYARTDTRIGSSGAGLYWNGKLDDVRIWSKALGIHEINELYNNSFSGRPGSMDIGEEEILDTGLAVANLTIGIYNSSFENMSLTIDESEKFRIWANYTYANGSQINETMGGWCNYTVDSLSSDNLSYNVSVPVYHSLNLSFPENGIYQVDVYCYNNLSAENETAAFNITVQNIGPTSSIGDIWYWLLPAPVSFTAAYAAKYPLESTINISAVCLDTDLDNVTYTLEYTTNGSVIDSRSFAASDPTNLSVQINYTAANFSTEENYLDAILGYTFRFVCFDNESANSTGFRTFYAGNALPSVSWDDGASVTIGSQPYNLSYSVTDAENDTGYCEIFYNDSIINTSVVSYPGTGFYLFNLSQGTYNFTVRCNDTFRYSSNDTLTVTFTQGCVINYSAPCEGCRYQDNIISGVSLGCSNGVNVTHAWYSINEFANVSISNWSLFNISSELGRNTVHFYIDSGGVVTSTSINYWAKDYDVTGFAAYIVLLVTLGLGILFFIFGNLTGHGFIHMMAGVCFIFFSIEVYALQPYLAWLFGGFSLIYIVWKVLE